MTTSSVVQSGSIEQHDLVQQLLQSTAGRGLVGRAAVLHGLEIVRNVWRR
jgi:hypothetical protein